MAARRLALGGNGIGGADDRDLFRHFVRSKAKGHGAAILDHRLDHPAPPFAVNGVDPQFGAARFLEHVAGAEAGIAERRIGFARAAEQASVDDGIADLAQQVLFALGQGVRLVQPRTLAADRHAF